MPQLLSGGPEFQQSMSGGSQTPVIPSPRDLMPLASNTSGPVPWS